MGEALNKQTSGEHFYPNLCCPQSSSPSMKGGLIAEIEGDRVELEDHQTVVPVEGEEFDELQHCIQIRNQITLPDGRKAQAGRAAIEDTTERETVEIRDGMISAYDRREKTTLYTEFVYLPGRFIAASTSRGSFVFHLIEEQANISANRIQFDLNEFLNDHRDAVPWKVGFYGRVGNAENGVVHGSELLRDSDIGDILNSANKNQIGLEYNYSGHLVKMFLTEGGYSEIYQPSNFDTGEFAQFVSDELLEYAVEA